MARKIDKNRSYSSVAMLIIGTCMFLVIYLWTDGLAFAKIEGDIYPMKERINSIKKSVVRVFVDNQPSGTGFVISKDGLIVTCFHVVDKIQKDDNGKSTITYASKIEVEFNNGEKIQAKIPEYWQNSHSDMIVYDYFFLKVDVKTPLSPMQLGNFSDAYEGANVYLAGYPLGINQAIVSRGMISTKWVQPLSIENKTLKREVAWLDITMNKGNSGGPVVLVGENPEDDKVIGMATFILNPFENSSKKIINIAQSFPGSAVIMGINFKDFATDVGQTMSLMSLGVSGCVSVEYIKRQLGL